MMYLKKYSKKTWFIAMISTFIFGLFTHLFGLVNIIHNYDSIEVQPAGVGSTLKSGRWFLHISCKIFRKIFGNYNLSLWNGIIFIFFISLSASLLVYTFNIKSRKNAILIGVIFITFPSATSTLFYRFTSHYYGLSIFFAVAATLTISKFKYGFILSSILIACSLGIYQAFVPFTIAIFVLLLIKNSLDEEIEIKLLIRRGIYYCCCIITGLIIYFLVLYAYLCYFDVSLSSYKGINNMGHISFNELPFLIIRTYFCFFKLPFFDYHNLAHTPLLKFLYIFLALLTAAYLIYIVIENKLRKTNALFTLSMCSIFPLAVNFIVIMCPNGDLYTLMLYPFMLVLCAPIIIYEALPITKEKRQSIKSLFLQAITIILLTIITSYAYFTNVNYTSLYYVNRQTENYLQSIITQVRMTEGFTTNRQWALIGKINDPLFIGGWSKHSLYGGNSNKLINSYSRNSWFKHYCGYSIPFADKETIDDIKQHNEFIEMPCWPNDGSIKVINNIIVIKFEDSEDSLN